MSVGNVPLINTVHLLKSKEGSQQSLIEIRSKDEGKKSGDAKRKDKESSEPQISDFNVTDHSPTIQEHEYDDDATANDFDGMA